MAGRSEARNPLRSAEFRREIREAVGIIDASRGAEMKDSALATAYAGGPPQDITAPGDDGYTTWTAFTEIDMTGDTHAFTKA